MGGDFSPFDSPRVFVHKSAARLKSALDGATGTWTVPTAPGGGTLRSFSVEPEVPQNLWAFTSTRLRLSTDWGDTWADQGAALPAASAGGGFVVMPGGQVIVVAADSSGLDNRVYRSTDRGATWATVTVGPFVWGSWRLHQMYHNKYVAGTIFAVEHNGPVWRSLDSGATWSSNKSLSFTSNYETMLFTRDRSILLFEHQQNAQPARYKIWRSTDNGDTWTLMRNVTDANFGDSNNQKHQTFAQADGGRIYFYGAELQSDDDGQTWQSGPRVGTAASLGGGMGRSDAALFASQNDVDVIVRSADGGVTWVAMNPVTDPAGRLDLVLTDFVPAPPGNVGPGPNPPTRPPSPPRIVQPEPPARPKPPKPVPVPKPKPPKPPKPPKSPTPPRVLPRPVQPPRQELRPHLPISDPGDRRVRRRPRRPRVMPQGVMMPPTGSLFQGPPPAGKSENTVPRIVPRGQVRGPRLGRG